MTVLQAWLLFGIPCLVLGMAMFIGHAMWRTMLGYLLLIAGFVSMMFFDRASGAFFGALIALVYAAGRGGTVDAGPDPLSRTSHEAIESVPEPVDRYASGQDRPDGGEGATPAGAPRVS